MSTWQVFAVLLTFAVLSGSTRIHLEDQGYVDIVVDIDHQVHEDLHLVQNLKDLLNSTSAFLHRATRELVYFKSVTIVLPHTWSDAIPFEPISGAMLSNADIRIRNMEEGEPYAVQAKGCGERGEYVVVPTDFVANLTTATKKKFKKPEYILTHKWAQFRYGVFDEFGSPGDVRYPSTYIRDGDRKPNVCSDQIAVSPQTEDGDPCDVVEGSTQDDCIDFVPIDQTTTAAASVMFLPVVSSVYTFCDDDEHKHNAEAPNPQNALCDSRSTWDVISHNSDFKGIKDPVVIQPTTFRILKAVVKERIVLVLDISGSMEGKRMEMLRTASARLIQDTVVDGAELGIVTFSTAAAIDAPLTVVNGTTRAWLQEKLPTGSSGFTSIGEGLLAGIKALENNSKSIENSVIILMSDGEENRRPSIKSAIPELVQKRVVVHTLALGTDADKGLEDLARETGGKSFAVTDENMQGLEKLEKAFVSASTVQRPIEEKPVTLISKSIPLEGDVTTLHVTVDSDLGKNLEFLASGGDVDTTEVTVKSPSGKSYDAKYDEHLKRYKVSPDDAEPGKWRVDIKRTNPASHTPVTITVASEAKNPDDPPVRLRTFYSTEKIRRAGVSTQFKIFAELKKGEKAVKGAHVVANVTTPSGEQVPVVLKDNGVGADIAEGDGIYSGFFTDFSSAGRYSVEVQANGDDGTNLVTPKQRSGAGSGPGHRARRSAGSLIFERYDSGPSFVVDEVEPAIVYPPETIRDLRVQLASYLDNGTRTVSLTWTSPGAHLDKGTCYNLTIITSRDRGTLQAENMTDDVYTIRQYDVVNGTLDPKPPGEAHEVTFLIPDTWFPPNNSAHDLYFIVNTWNPDGIKSNRSNIAVANFVEQLTEVVVAERELSFWEKLLASKTALYVGSSLLAGVFFIVIVVLVVRIFARKSSPSKGVDRVAVFRTGTEKCQVASRTE